jgi:hypothetical protein
METELGFVSDRLVRFRTSIVPCWRSLKSSPGSQLGSRVQSVSVDSAGLAHRAVDRSHERGLGRPISSRRGRAETLILRPRHFACLDPPISRQSCAYRWRSREGWDIKRRKNLVPKLVPDSTELR